MLATINAPFVEVVMLIVMCATFKQQMAKTFEDIKLLKPNGVVMERRFYRTIYYTLGFLRCSEETASLY